MKEVQQKSMDWKAQVVLYSKWIIYPAWVDSCLHGLLGDFIRFLDFTWNFLLLIPLMTKSQSSFICVSTMSQKSQRCLQWIRRYIFLGSKTDVRSQILYYWFNWYQICMSIGSTPEPRMPVTRRFGWRLLTNNVMSSCVVTGILGCIYKVYTTYKISDVYYLSSEVKLNLDSPPWKRIAPFIFDHS